MTWQSNRKYIGSIPQCIFHDFCKLILRILLAIIHRKNARSLNIVMLNILYINVHINRAISKTNIKMIKNIRMYYHYGNISKCLLSLSESTINNNIWVTFLPQQFMAFLFRHKMEIMYRSTLNQIHYDLCWIFTVFYSKACDTIENFLTALYTILCHALRWTQSIKQL